MQGNARRLLDKRWDSNSRFGKLSKLGLAPILWFVILVLLVLYAKSVILSKYSGHQTGFAPKLVCNLDLNKIDIKCFSLTLIDEKLPRLSMGFGLLAWLGIFLATAGIVMFYRCSR